MLIKENKKLGRINSPPSNINIFIMASASSEAPSASLTMFKNDASYEKILIHMAMNSPFVIIDDITAINARKNLHLQIPLRAPSLVQTEKGPTWRNLVIPKDPVRIDMI